MDIATLKSRFESTLQPAPDHTLIDVQPAWEFFKTSMGEGPDGEYCEEFGFSFSEAEHFDGSRLIRNPDQFQVYFGRLIDVDDGHPWRTAEIDFYYRYAMTAELRSLLYALPVQDIETAYCKADGEDAIRRKIETVTAYADGQPAIWEALRGLEPVTSSFRFWVY
jgi:hypothetical protein